MNNYLLQLLKEVKTIIIPGLGALTLTNEATGEMMFMNYLKFDDGTLAKHIAEKEGIELNDASNTIAKFVREVQAEIDKGNSYDMYQFGSFKKEGGETVFEQWSAGQKPDSGIETTVIAENIPPVKPTSTIESTIASENIPTTKIDLDSESTVTEENIPPVVSEIKIEEVKEPEIELTESGFDTEHAEPVVEEKPIEVVETIQPINDVPEEVKPEPNVAPSPKDVVIANDKKSKNKENSPLPAEQKKKKTSAFTYILWGIVVLILGGATYVAVNYDSMKEKYPILAELAGEDTLNVTRTKSMLQPEDTLLSENDEPIAPDTAREPEPIAKPESTKPVPAVVKPAPAPKPVPVPKPIPTPKPVVTQPVVKKPVSAPKPAVVPVPKPVISSTPKPAVSRPRPVVNSNIAIVSADPSKPFHVIGGSFSSEDNAKNFARKMIGKGAKASVLQETNGMYRVSISSFASKEEAVESLGYLHSFVPTAWVLKWP